MHTDSNLSLTFDKIGLTKSERVIPWRDALKLAKFFVGILDIVRKEFNAMVKTCTNDGSPPSLKSVRESTT